MISIDQLEVLLRTVPNYLLFAGIALYIFSWMNKKERYGLWGDIVFVCTGILSLVVMLSGMIPSPKLEGVVEEDIKKVINLLTMGGLIGLLSAISLAIRLIHKKANKIVFYLIFVVGVILFFQSTSLSKVKFQLNRPESESIQPIELKTND